MQAPGEVPQLDGRPPLLGRAVELGAIESLLDDVHVRGSALVLRGDPGIGKSRLLTAGATMARDRGMAVLSATGVQSESRLPFAGLHQLLRPVRAAADHLPSTLRVALDAAFGLTDDVAPELSRTAMAVLEVLSDSAASTPLLVTIEDAHWLDNASAAVIAFVARRLESDPIVLLAATRDGYGAPLGRDLPQMRLDPLTPGVAGELLDTSSAALSPAARERVLAEAAGNPLALIELPSAAAGGRELSMSRDVPMTERLEQAFAARISELPDDTQLLVLIAALIDGDEIAEVLRAAAIHGTRIDAAAFDPAVQAAILDVDLHSFRFRHPLMRSAVRRSASLARRLAVHAALAELLADEPDRRVWHRAALITGPHEEIATELEQAARSATRRGAAGEAFAALRRAADLSEPSHAARRLLAAAQLAQAVGEHEAVAHLLRQTRQHSLGSAERARANWLEEMSDPRAFASEARALALIAAAARAGEDGDPDLEVDLLWLVAFRLSWADAGPSARQALVDASSRLGGADSDDARVVLITACADPLGHARDVVLRLETTLAAGGYDPLDARDLGAAAYTVGAFDIAMTLLSVADDSLRAEGRLGYLGRILVLRALIAARLADWSTAIPAAEESRRLAVELGDALVEARAEAAIATIAGMRGDVDAAERAAASAERIAATRGVNDTVASAQVGRVLAALGEGDYSRAYRAAVRAFDSSDPAHHLVNAVWLVGDLAEAATHIGRLEEARRHLDYVERAAGARPPRWASMNFRYAHALLADDEQAAEESFRVALEADLSHWPFQRARIELARGRWLRRRRRVAESRAPLRHARDRFDSLGCVAWSDRAREELRASGESSPQRHPAGRDTLTAQELQIAQLAATGLSNREIGERLYVSPRTVSTHLYRVFPKLGITSRADLAAALSPLS